MELNKRIKRQISKHGEIVVSINEKVQPNELKIGNRVTSFTQIRKLFLVSHDATVYACNGLKPKNGFLLKKSKYIYCVYCFVRKTIFDNKSDLQISLKE